eukprot:scpid65034/ scgid5129/ 
MVIMALFEGPLLSWHFVPLCLLCTILVGSQATRTVPERCCRRASNVISLGFDVTGKTEVTRDVGKCVRNCAGLRGLNHNKGCDKPNKCYPNRLIQETVFLENGTVDVSIIDSCLCQTVQDTPCSVHRQEVLYYAGTSFQRSINRGVCLGQDCSGNSGKCQASAFKTVSIRGPNGKRCVSVTDNCSCAQSGCVRQRHKVAVLASVKRRDSVTGVMHLSNTTKLIDLGVCGGQCPVRTGRRCFGGPTRCLYYQTNPRACYPSRTDSVTYTDASTGKLTHLARVVECACGTAPPSLLTDFRAKLLENSQPPTLP